MNTPLRVSVDTYNKNKHYKLKFTWYYLSYKYNLKNLPISII